MAESRKPPNQFKSATSAVITWWRSACTKIIRSRSLHIANAPTSLDNHSRSSSSSNQANDVALADSALMMTVEGSRSINSTAPGLSNETLPPNSSTSLPTPNVADIPLLEKTSAASIGSTPGALANTNGVRETTKQSPARNKHGGLSCIKSQHSPCLTTLNFNSMGRKRKAQVPPACKRAEHAARKPAMANTSDNGSGAALWMITIENRTH